MKRITGALLVAGFAISACATAQSADSGMSEKDAAKLAQYEPTGEVKNCISSNFIRSIDAIGEKVLLVTANNGRTYLNRVSGRCSGADEAWTFIKYSTTTGQLCRNEIINVVDNSGGFIRGSCGLGDFEEVVKKAPEAPADE